MNRVLFAKAAKDGRALFLALLVLFIAFPWLNIWLASKISLPAFADFLANALPKKWEKFSAVSFSEMASPAGRIAIVYIHPILTIGTALWAIARGSDCVSGEIGRGTMELLLAQPITRTSIYATQAIVGTLGAALLAAGTLIGTTIGLRIVPLDDEVSASLFIPAAVSLFALTFCLGGIAALASSWGSQRSRTIGLLGGVYAVSTVMALVGRMSGGWQWLRYLSFMSCYEPQAMVARPNQAWNPLAYDGEEAVGIGLGARIIVLLAVGLGCYIAGCAIFNRREIPAPL
jgi:ABC-2 type transport system permease protein